MNKPKSTEMTNTQAVEMLLNGMKSGNCTSGWRLFDAVTSMTGRKPYPTTLLQSARRIAKKNNWSFTCVDRQTSEYMLTK